MLYNYLTNFLSHCDAPHAWQFGIQDPATPALEGMISFHNFLMIFVLMIGIVVFWLLIKILISFNEYSNPTPQKFTHSSLLEIVWTLIPAFVLLIIAVPSFSLLYSLDELIDPSLTVKVVGHQWYWSYEFNDPVLHAKFGFDSYMVNTSDLKVGNFRLLEVDQRVMLPINTHVRLLVTASDVLHSWAVPSFGVKIDACPGRISQVSLYIKREGVYYGQCSEICGVNHGFMPIVVKGLSTSEYTLWSYLRNGSYSEIPTPIKSKDFENWTSFRLSELRSFNF